MVQRNRDIRKLLFKLPCSMEALVFAAADILQKKFNLKFMKIVIQIGSPNVGVSDVDINHHYKKVDVKEELEQIYELEKVMGE